ncbi:DUF2165 domain-containing protein [Methanococcoides sp. SA1]|nr:DUF2165 domain-containing protein [Methanococcoides sp. SA1]
MHPYLKTNIATKTKKEWIKITNTTLVLILGIYFLIAVIGNITDYQTNYAFVQHTLQMDTTFQSPNLMWRSINNETTFHIFYWIIILTEALAALLLLKGSLQMFKKNKSGQTCAIKGLLISMIIWFGYFITVGGEWFAMWQSSSWNGLDPAFRMFVISGIIFLSLTNDK